MLAIHFAPIQGHTNHIYRQLHNLAVGGIDYYYTPFLRIEKGGLRNKDLKDILPENNQSISVIPQIICNSREEFAMLCDIVQGYGWKAIDLNLGCPFPLQTHSKRGAGLLPYPDIIQEIIEEMRQRNEIRFSIKMRIGLSDKSEGLNLIPILNDSPIHHLTIHPRLGTQQYKGEPNLEAFSIFVEQCTKPLIYNGDITTPTQIHQLESRYPNLSGVMIGRGLLARPSLAIEYKENRELSTQEQFSILLNIHDKLFAYAEQHLQGDSQILNYMQSFWEYASIDKKSLKRLTKCGNLQNYLKARLNLEQDSAN